MKRLNIGLLFKEVIMEIKPSEEELRGIGETLANHIKKIRGNIQKRKINAEVFVGGSAAKGTLIKKYPYDIDIFIRFDKKYKNEILSDLTEKTIAGMRGTRIHGSRDYFKIKSGEGLFFEVIPVRRVKNPGEAENVTDLSYSHVNYVKKKIKSQKLLDEIRLAKAFCYANNAYGAESYVGGFSGYALELLVYHYGSFLKFVKEIAKMDLSNKVIIDIERHHKNKNRVLTDLNEAKLKSPIVLVDPTYKQRNVLAALSEETFRNFQGVCRNFLKNPKIDFFRQKTVNIEKVRADAGKRGYEFILLEIATNKQEGDVAGSKLLKFYRHLTEEIGKFCEVKAKGFEYHGKKSARVFFVAKKKPWILVTGPMVSDENNANKFKSVHKSVFIKNGRIYSKYNPEFTLEEFINKFENKNRKRIREMSITDLRFI